MISDRFHRILQTDGTGREDHDRSVDWPQGLTGWVKWLTGEIKVWQIAAISASSRSLLDGLEVCVGDLDASEICRRPGYPPLHQA